MYILPDVLKATNSCKVV